MRVGCRFGLLGLQLGDALDLPRIELARRRRIVLTDPIDQDHIEAPGLFAQLKQQGVLRGVIPGQGLLVAGELQNGDPLGGCQSPSRVVMRWRSTD